MKTTACADTSFLFSLYVEDAHSAMARRFMIKLGQPVMLTPFNEFEFAQALRLGLHRKLLVPSDVAMAEASFERDRSEGFLLDSTLPIVAVLQRARGLATKHTALTGCRSMDLLHVASALEEKATHLLSFDSAQKKLAQAEGLKTSL
jgi:predicted nucleic acid-binding protein